MAATNSANVVGARDILLAFAQQDAEPWGDGHCPGRGPSGHRRGRFHHGLQPVQADGMPPFPGLLEVGYHDLQMLDGLVRLEPGSPRDLGTGATADVPW